METEKGKGSHEGQKHAEGIERVGGRRRLKEVGLK